MKLSKFILCLTVFILIASCCKQEMKLANSLKNKVKSIYIDTKGDNGRNDSSPKILEVFSYNNSNLLNNIKFFIKVTQYDSFSLHGEFLFRYDNSNMITIDEIGIDNVNRYHQYKVYYDANKYITAFNETDIVYSTEYPIIRCVHQNNRLDSFFEKQYIMLLNRKCYDYKFDGNNYTSFKFEYDWSNFSSNVHILDSTTINYTNIPNTPYAPMQNMYSANTLVNAAFGEPHYDIVYFLGIEGYMFYTPNRNLVDNIRCFFDSTAIVYMNYQFNTNNQLENFNVFYRTPTTLAYTYSFEYY